MTKRRKLTPRQKAEIREGQGGMCFLCHEPLDLSPDDPTEFDHAIPLALGGDDTIENLTAVHASCHRGPGGKTKADVRQIAKAKRRARKLGVERETNPVKRRGPKLQGKPFDKTRRRRMDGTVEKREAPCPSH